MSETRENRTFAQEVKFVVDAALGGRIRDWTRAHLQPDPHGAGPFGDEYHTASIYFDTQAQDVFHRRGSYGRAKYRIRRYADADFAFLERKLRKPGIVAKRRTRVPIELLSRLSPSADGETWPGSWFQSRIAVRQLRPSCRVSYTRLARVHADGQGLARLTLDTSLSVLPASAIGFSEGAGMPMLSEQMILELKYRAVPPAIFKRLIEEFGLKVGTASKYRLGMAMLGHVAKV
jgi:VTC domain